MTIVITMAGLGSRFKKAGYTVPKYMIEAHGKTLFEWSMESLSGFYQKGNSYVFIVRKEDGSRDFIEAKCKEMNFENVTIIEIDYLTDGQATTAMLASEFWDKQSELMIYNIDTYVEADEMHASQIAGDGFIPCFHAPGDHWSFVKLNADGSAEEVREKVRISDNCTLGAYYFKSCGLYEELYREYYSSEEKLEKGEKYVAPLYNYLISKGGDVRISIVDYNKVHVLGTPEELQVFIDEYTA
ncbi:glycosyltransferase family 2 protein [Konateibacter massiliensis]|uniref:glycosyltransferase family 2 protein n=1 Tax=Konateibacter massiliensis TaxID=2002841 RepID=UPI001F2A2FC3|nr:glycosyltransferase family 2 protein [Konateibacter massiliensis]